MLDGCHTASAVETAVDLANTLRPITGEDALDTVEQLRGFLDAHSRAGPRRLTRTDLAEVRALRDTLRAALESAGADAVGAAALINDGLLRCRATTVLRHDGDAWCMQVIADADALSAHLAATTLGALASVIVALGPSRLGVCAGPACRATFVDLSRNGSKQYCTRTCAHRASVAAYRSRQSSR